MQQETYAIFLDLDGTLSDGGKISRRDRAAINAVREKGHYVYLNTGRARASIPDYVTQEIPFDGLVAGIGSYVSHQDKILFSAVIEQPLLGKTADLLWQGGYPHIFEGEEKVLYAHLDVHEGRERAYSLSLEENFNSTYKDERITKATIVGQLTAEDVAWLDQHFFVIQHEHYAEFALLGLDKATGMQLVLDHLGLDRQKSIAIGDSDNDLAMLEAAGISVAMGNAPDSVKALCSEVTEAVGDSGVAVFLEKFLLQAL